MKKIFVIILSAILIAIIGAISVGIWIISNKSLQTDIVNSLLKNSHASISSANLSLKKIDIENFKIETEKGIFTAEKFSLQYKFFTLLTGKFKGKGSLKNAVFTLVDSPTKAQEECVKQTKVSQKNFALPVSIEIDSFTTDIKITNGENTASVSAQIKNLKISKTNVEFLLRANIEANSLNYVIVAEKLNKSINAKISENNNEILLLSGTVESFCSADITSKLILTTETLKPLTDIFKISLPKIDTQIYAQTKFNSTKNFYSANITAKTSLTDIQKIEAYKKSPFNECEIQLQTNFSTNGENISLEKINCIFETDNIPVLQIERSSPLSVNWATLNESHFLEIGEATVAITPQIISSLLRAGNFSAEHIGGIFVISANKNGIVKIKSKKQANILNAVFYNQGTTIFNGLTLFFDTDATADLKNNVYSLDAKILSQIVDNKRFVIDLNAEKNKNYTKLNISANGALNPILNRINSISSRIATDMSAEVDAEIELGKTLKISKINASVKTTESANALTLSAPSAIELDFIKGDYKSNAVVNIQAQDFPFAPIRPLIQNADAQKLSFDAKVKFSGTKIKTNGKFSISEFSYQHNNQPMLENIDAETEFNIDFDIEKKSLSFDTGKIKILDTSTAFFTGSASADAQLGTFLKIKNFKADVDFQLPQIMKQPLLARFNNLARASGKATINIDETSKLNANITITNFASKSTTEDLESLKLKAEASLTNPLKVDLSAEINSTRGTTKISANAQKSEKISTNINAERIIVEDIIVLKDAFTNPLFIEKTDGKKKKFARPDEAYKQSPLESLQQKDSKAFWNCATDISATTKIDELLLSGKSALKDFSASFDISDKSMSISKLTSKMLDGTLSGEIKIRFDELKQMPYCLEKSAIKLENFSFEKLSEEDFLTGTYNANASISGNGINIRHLLNYIVGNVSIQAKNGSIRLINESSDIGQKISIAHSAAKLANQFLGNKDVDNSLRLLEMFAKINFKTATFALSRNSTDFNINIDSAEITAENLLLKTQKGIIYFSADRDFIRQDMQIDVAIYTNNSTLISMLSTVNAIANKSNLDGFKQSETFKIYGTLEKPKTNLMDILSGKTTSATATKLLKKRKLFK